MTITNAMRLLRQAGIPFDTSEYEVDESDLSGVHAAAALGVPYHEGVAHSHESFYHDENDAESEYWSKKGVLGADMESAALLTIGRLRGMKAASILNNVVLYGEDTADAVADYAGGESLTARGERDEIRVALEAFARLDARRKGRMK